MSNNFKLHTNNLLFLPGVGWFVSSEDSAYPKRNLLIQLASRVFKFTSNSGEYIILNTTGGLAGFASCTDLSIYNHNITSAGGITIQAHDDDTFGGGTPNIELTKTISEDPDTDPSLWNENGITIAPYSTLHFPLGQDILSGNTWIKIIFDDPTNANPIQIGKIHIGSGLQWSRNFNDGWRHTFDDNTPLIQTHGNRPLSCSRSVEERIRLTFRHSESVDTNYMRQFIREFGTHRHLFVSIEPEEETQHYANDGKRSHQLTMYGTGIVRRITEVNMFQHHSYEFEFEKAVA